MASQYLTITDPTSEECVLILELAEAGELAGIEIVRQYNEVPPWWHDSDYKQYQLRPCDWTLEFTDG